MTAISLRRVLAVGLLGTLPVLAGCEDEDLMPPTATEGAMFARYVAIGNSITAGYQSGGINDSTQNESYAKLLADALGTEFNQPLFNSPGCPAPYTNILTGARYGSPTEACYLRSVPVPSVLHNVAVPGAAVLDVLDNLDAQSRANTLTNLILGGRTQMEVAAAAYPTFATVWIGNNDVLGAALAGDTASITPAATFTSRYNAMVDSLEAIGVQGAVLIGVVDVTLAPNLSYGVAYWMAAQAPGWPPTFGVAANCGPTVAGGVGQQVLVPFAYGIGTLFAQAAAGTPVSLNCAAPPVIDAGKITMIRARIAAFNAAISAAATAKGWAYFDPNSALLALWASGDIPAFPNLANPAALFGSYVSQDGVHPAGPTHRIVSDSLLAIIRRTNWQ